MLSLNQYTVPCHLLSVIEDFYVMSDLDFFDKYGNSMGEVWDLIRAFLVMVDATGNWSSEWERVDQALWTWTEES